MTWKTGWLLAAVAMAIPGVEARSETRGDTTAAAGDRVVAIDVLLLPDAAMVKKAVAANAELRRDYPQGYALGKEQVAHVSLVHAYVREKDLPAIEAEVAKLAEEVKPLEWDLTANGYTSAPWSGVTITTIGIQRIKPLDAFQADVQKIVNRYTATGGTAAAFAKSRELPKIEPAIIPYVKDFAKNSSGAKYHPHVTVGVAHEDFVEEMKAKAFTPFTFKPTAIAIYQLGGYGTAQKELWRWKPSDRGGAKQ